LIEKEHSKTKVITGGLLAFLGGVCIWVGFIGVILSNQHRVVFGWILFGGIVEEIAITVFAKVFFGNSVWDIYDAKCNDMPEEWR